MNCVGICNNNNNDNNNNNNNNNDNNSLKEVCKQTFRRTAMLLRGGGHCGSCLCPDSGLWRLFFFFFYSLVIICPPSPTDCHTWGSWSYSSASWVNECTHSSVCLYSFYCAVIRKSTTTFLSLSLYLSLLLFFLHFWKGAVLYHLWIV